MSLKYCLLASVGAALALQPAFAQTQPAPAAGQAEDVIVITGTALARKEALEEKKEDSRTIEALGVDELGQLPDKNVGESLNRLPGVSMLVEKGEGRYVQVRGVSSNLNNVTVNGVQMGSPEVELGGRQAPLDIISGGVLGGVQVIKTPTPDMDAQGIGGTVNVDTKMPFDRPESFYGYLTGRYGYEEERPREEAFGGHDPYAIDGTLSGKVGDTFGWLIGGTWSAREYVSTGVYQDDWTRVPSIVPGATADTFLPVNVKNNYYIIGRERLNLNGALEWRPQDGAKYFVRGFYGSWDEYQWRNRYEQNLTFLRNATTPNIALTSPTAGTQGTDRILANIRLEYADKTVSSLAAGGENVIDRMTVDYLIQANKNEIAEPNDQWEWRSGASAVGPSTFVLGGDGVVTITPNAGTPDRTSPALLPLRRIRFFNQDMEEDALIGQINARYELSDEIYLKAGVKASSTERDLDVGQTEYAPNGTPITLGTSPSFHKGGFINQTQKGDVPNVWMDVHGMNAYFRDPANAARFAPNTVANVSSDFASDYDLTETILAGYVMARGEFGPWEVIGGVRVEATDVDSSGYLLRSVGSAAPVPTLIHAGGDYTETLPGLLVNYRPNSDWVIRGAVTRALGRPEYDQIAPRSTFSQNGAIGSVSIGNPDLVARKSWNYDIGVEWYPNDLTALAASFFYKDISDQLTGETNSFTTQAAMQAELNRLGFFNFDTTGLTRLDSSTTINAGDAFLQGVELSAQTQFEFLPAPFDGLGASIGATFIDGEIGDGGPLVGQPEETYAFTGFYQKGPIDISVSYAYNASYLTDNNADPLFRLDQGEFGRWDAKASYAINDNFKVFIEGVNLNDEPTSEFQGGVVSRNTEFEYVGRTVYLGASWGF